MERVTYDAMEDGKIIACQVFIEKQFLLPDECDVLIAYFKQAAPSILTTGNGFFDGRVIWYPHVPTTHPARAIMRDAKTRTRQRIKECYGLGHDVYGDSIQLVCWPEGIGMAAHYDNRHPNRHEIHSTPWREYGAVVYLNDEYAGGELFIESANPTLFIKPQKGMLVVFGGGDGYFHGVQPAYGVTRYTMPCWFTTDITKAESD